MVLPVDSTSHKPTVLVHYKAIQESLEKAEILFFNFEGLTVAEKDEMTTHLRVAYRELYKVINGSSVIPKDLETSAARLFYLYGKSLYGGNMEETHEMFQLSLVIQLIHLKYLPSKSLTLLHFKPELDATRTELTRYKAFREQIDSMLSSDIFGWGLVEIALKEGPEQAFNTAMIFRWIGATYQNMDSYSKPDSDGIYKYAMIFKNVYGLADSILKEIQSRESQWQRAQILYNTGRFLYGVDHQRPKELAKLETYVEGTLSSLDGLKCFLDLESGSARAMQLTAQIHNIKTIERKACEPSDPEEKKGWLRRQFDEVSLAVVIATKNEIEPFLRALFFHNKAGWALKALKAEAVLPEIDRPETLRSWIQETITYMEHSRPHIYFPHFYQTAIDIGEFLGDKEWVGKCQVAKAAMEAALKPQAG